MIHEKAQVTDLQTRKRPSACFRIATCRRCIGRRSTITRVITLATTSMPTRASAMRSASRIATIGRRRLNSSRISFDKAGGQSAIRKVSLALERPERRPRMSGERKKSSVS